MKRDNHEGALVQLRAYIAQGEFAHNDRLPPERILCTELGIARSELRKAFAVLEMEGAIWRHVGRGTFVGNGHGHGVDAQSMAMVAKRSTPSEVMYARQVLEPQLARAAALHATTESMDQLRENCRKIREAATWRQYETLDNEFHSLVAEATQNTPLIAMYDQLNALRRTIVWGRLRRHNDYPPTNHHSFDGHEAVFSAIERRDADAARDAMKKHLNAVSKAVFPSE